MCMYILFLFFLRVASSVGPFPVITCPSQCSNVTDYPGAAQDLRFGLFGFVVWIVMVWGLGLFRFTFKFFWGLDLSSLRVQGCL